MVKPPVLPADAMTVLHVLQIVPFLLWSPAIAMMPPTDPDQAASRPAVAVHTPPPNSEERRELLHVARAPAETLLGQPLLLTVEALNVTDQWAFVYARMRSAASEYIDYSQTPLAEASRNGAVSDVYVALLARQEDGWTVVESRVGPTDAAWLAWPADTGAPEEVFALD